VLTIEVRDEGGCSVLALRGEVDAWTVPEFREAVAGVVGVERIVIDLCGTAFMDSAGLGALIGGIRRAREAGGDLAVACSPRPLLRLLHTTGLDRIVVLVESVEDAVAALAEPDAAALA
jgi:anti-sigma B factor antagonist